MNIYVAADDNYEWTASFNDNAAAKPEKEKNGLYKFTYQVAAKDMDNEIQFYINKKVNTAISVSDYLTELNSSESEGTPLANLADAMESYGNAAKSYFSSGTVAEQTVTADMSVYDFTVDKMPEGITYYGSSLILESETTIRHYFTLADDKNISDFAFTVDGEEVTPVAKQGCYYIDIENISAEKLGTAFTVSINGEDVITGYSALSYAMKVLESENTNANLKNLVKALYIYYHNALAYNAA